MRNTLSVSGTIVLLVLVCVSRGSVSQEPKKATLEDDLKKLHETWRTKGSAEPRLELRIQVVEQDGRLKASAVYLPQAYQVPLIELKELVMGRVIEHKNPAPQLGLTSVPYHFDGDTLILIVREGTLKGEHRLTRAKGSTSVVLTPDTMGTHGFKITCRVSDAAIDGENKKPGLLQVHLSFDAEKGPAIATTAFASLVMRDGDSTLLSVPVQLASGSSRKVHRYVTLLIHKDVLPKVQLALIPMGFDPPPSHFIDLGAFAAAAGRAAPKSKTNTSAPRGK